VWRSIQYVALSCNQHEINMVFYLLYPPFPPLSNATNEKEGKGEYKKYFWCYHNKSLLKCKRACIRYTFLYYKWAKNISSLSVLQVERGNFTVIRPFQLLVRLIRDVFSETGSVEVTPFSFPVLLKTLQIWLALFIHNAFLYEEMSLLFRKYPGFRKKM